MTLTVRMRNVIASAVGGAAIFVMRAAVICVYGSSIPFWDQWGAEGGLFKALLEGEYKSANLLSPHNEHRILVTRLFNIAIFNLNSRQWDNVVEAYMSSVIVSVAYGILMFVLFRESSKKVAYITGFFIILIGGLPFGWENTLVGFQSQIYFLLLFTFCGLWIVASSNSGAGTAVGVFVFGVGCLFSIASGFLLGLAGIFVLVLRRMRRELAIQQVATRGILLVLMTL